MDPIERQGTSSLSAADVAPSPTESGEPLLAMLGAADPEHVALRTPDGRTALTFAALEADVERLAGALAGGGIGAGDCVAVMVPRGVAFVPILLAVTAIGATAAPLNPAYTRDECAFYLDDLGARAVIAPAGEGTALRAAAESVEIIDLESEDGQLALKRGGRPLAASATPSSVAGPDDVALLLHTSGTTSRPKQVPLLHRNLMASTRAIASHYALGADDVSFAAMPLFHVHGLVASVFAQLAAGGTVIAPEGLNARDFWSALGADGVTWFSGSPTVLTMLLDRRRTEATAPALRFTRSCSAPLSDAFARRIEDELSVPILQAYGMTEASHQIASNPLPPGSRDPASVGLATGTQVTVLDGDGRELPAGEAGEIAIRGPSVISGYLNNPEANATAFSGDWFRTGDLGAMDAGGYIRLQARLKELINRGGEKVSPYEVEDVLRSHPAVADAACFAVPDAKYGEVVGAAIVTRDAVEKADLRSYCSERLAAFKVPRAMEFRDTLPKTATGKVLRYRLAAEFPRNER